MSIGLSLKMENALSQMSDIQNTFDDTLANIFKKIQDVFQADYQMQWPMQLNLLFNRNKILKWIINLCAMRVFFATLHIGMSNAQKDYIKTYIQCTNWL